MPYFALRAAKKGAEARVQEISDIVVDGIWLDLPGADLLPDDPLDVLAPWLRDEGPPRGEPTETDAPPLRSNDRPPAQHPGWFVAAVPGCPTFHRWVRDRPSCDGLPGDVAERAFAYQQATIRDPKDWTAATAGDGARSMRNPSAMGIYRVLAHFAHPDISQQQGLSREELLREVLHPDGGNGRSALETWEETSDFQANGVVRLLYLYADKTWAPDPSHPSSVEPVVPCDLQWDAVDQLLGYKYFGDEPARHPDAPGHTEVYWSENHQLLFATAEYLAGQLMPDATFQSRVHKKSGTQWSVYTDSSWSMSADERMARGYRRLVRWLDHRLMFGLSEWTSPVYFDYDIAALLNLVDFCDDDAVADKAAIVLDVVLLELARFAGHGHGPGTAGRAYPSHKYTSWSASVSDTLQILFGQWDTEPRAEEVMETWRLEGRAARRAEELAQVKSDAKDAAEDKGLNDDAVAAAVDAAAAAWESAHPLDFHDRRRATPLSYIWNAADSVGAHSLATCQRYCIPRILFHYADAHDGVGRFERSRVSIDFDEGARDYGIGFYGQRNILDWWGRGGFGAPQTIVGSRDLADAWDVEEVDPFDSMPGLLLLPDPILEAAATKLSVESLGSCLTTANLCLWREGDLALSSAQKFRFGQVGRQAQIWQANLGPYITVWSTYPAAKSSETDSDGPSWWCGNAAQPRVVQHDDALICVHDSNLFSYTHITYGYRSHAWFPVQMFHEAVEVRRPDPDDDDNVQIKDLLAGTERREPFGLNADRGGAWWFGRWNDCYVGLFSAKDGTELLRTGRWADREILCEDRVNIFVCQVGTKARYGSFSQFVETCAKARIHVGLGVYQPSNPFVDIQCSYDVPFGRRLSLNLEDRYPSWHGQPFSDERFPRWETPWSRILWGERDYTLTAPDGLGGMLTLRHDCRNGIRTGTGL